MTAIELLRRLGACEIPAWVTDEMPPREAYERCDNAEDLVWVLGELGLDSRTLRLLAVDLAAAVLSLMPEGEDRPRRCVETSYRYLEGEASLEELDTARAATWATLAAAWAADAAAWTADAAARAADAACAADTVDWAADAAVEAAAGTEINLPAVVRRRVPWETVRRLIERSKRDAEL